MSWILAPTPRLSAVERVAASTALLNAAVPGWSISGSATDLARLWKGAVVPPKKSLNWSEDESAPGVKAAVCIVVPISWIKAPTLVCESSPLNGCGEAYLVAAAAPR